jgi:DNA-binding response OmpR family regulator
MEQPNRTELRLLVIEDEILIAMELADLLEDLGHQVIGVAGTLGRSLRLVEELGEKLDAVLLDANLGGMSSEPVAQELRLRGVPFLVASGYASDELVRFGFDEPRVGKPYRRDDIQSALSAL